MGFGKIYQAVGPQASDVSSLKEIEDMLCALYDAMLTKAHSDTDIKHILLPALSVAIFAGSKPGVFTKEEFIYAAYWGMIKGIKKFEKANSGHTLEIILNVWDTKNNAISRPEYVVLKNIPSLP